MLRFESVFWASKDSENLKKRLSAIGFLVSPSRINPEKNNLFFGPESIELVSADEKEGITGIGLATSDIAHDFERVKKMNSKVGKPERAKTTTSHVPDWFAFDLPSELTPNLNARAVMQSNQFLELQTRETLPALHSNTCFGIEAVHFLSVLPETLIKKWSDLLEKSVAKLQWSEMSSAAAWRLQTNERFFDVVTLEKDSKLSKASREQEGIFMITLKVTDLELAKEICKKAGAQVLNCQNRDGFIVPTEFTGGPALRFARAFWKSYLPEVTSNYPDGRRTDAFRPLGGANTSTLQTGFQDDWSY
jgi:hypothetical protein